MKDLIIVTGKETSVVFDGSLADGTMCIDIYDGDSNLYDYVNKVHAVKIIAHLKNAFSIKDEPNNE